MSSTLEASIVASFNGLHKFTRGLARSSSEGEVYAFLEMINHVALLREFSEPFADLLIGVMVFGDWEGSPTN